MEKVITIALAVLIVLVAPGILFWGAYDVTGFSNSLGLPELTLWQSIAAMWLVAITGGAFNGISRSAQ